MKEELIPLLQIERSNGKVVIWFQVNAITEKNFVQIADDLEQISRIPHPQTVIMDLTGVREVDAIGGLILQSLRDSVKEVGGTVTILKPAGLTIMPDINKQLRQKHGDHRHLPCYA